MSDARLLELRPSRSFFSLRGGLERSPGQPHLGAVQQLRGAAGRCGGCSGSRELVGQGLRQRRERAAVQVQKGGAAVRRGAPFFSSAVLRPPRSQSGEWFFY